MNRNIVIIQHASTSLWPAGLWMLDPVLLANEKQSIVVDRNPHNGALKAKTTIYANTDWNTDEIDKLCDQLFALTERDAHFPVRTCTQTMNIIAIEMRFNFPQYSTPTLYCGAAQIRPEEVFNRAQSLVDIIKAALAASITADEFIEQYTTERLRYADTI